MEREALIFVGSCDLAGIVRGKGFPATAQAQRLHQGVGLTHSNIMMSAFGPIYDTPYGTLGDLMLVPDPTTYVEAGLGIVAAFEQEFVYTGVEHREGATYSLDAWRRQGSYGEHVMAALRSAGLAPDSFLPEY